MRGYTLTELMVVVGIIAVLLALSVFQYQRYSKRYYVERLTKELYSDLMKARMEAFQSNISRIVRFSSTDYTILEDIDGNGTISSKDREVYVKNLQQYHLKWALGGGSNTIVFDGRGLLNREGRVWFTDARGNLIDAEYDCVQLRFTRINLGKYNASNSSCESK